MLRFLALTWNPADTGASTAAAELRRRIDDEASWTEACAAPGLCALATEARPEHDVRVLRASANASWNGGGVEAGAAESRDASTFPSSGVVLGEVFDRSNGSVATLTPSAERAVATTGGAHLVDDCWGSWVAILRSPDGGRALRAPAGSLRCFHLRRRSVDIWCSDIEDAVPLVGEPLALDRRYIASALLDRTLVLNATGLVGVSEVLGGQRLTAEPSGLVFDWQWRPGAAGRASPLGDERAAATALRATVQATVDAWAGRHRRIVHRLSGGLDSSIVLGCLACAPSRPRVSCLTYFIAPATVGSHGEPASLAAAEAGDERGYARLAAAAAGCRLIERERRLEEVDLSTLMTAHRTARPSWLAFSPDIDRMDVEVVRELGADAVFTGRGGDGVFFASPGAWPAIDAAFLHGLHPRLVARVLEGARMSRRSAWATFQAALTQGLLRRPRVRARPHAGVAPMLSAEATALASADDVRPPWLPLCAGLPPSKAVQIHAVFAGHHYAEPFECGRVAAVVDPLLSQPVIDTVLAIPTATLAADATSRGLARRAFADVLPDAIRRRRSKAGGDAFTAALIRRNMTLARELLLDGRLVQMGLLDREAVEASLAAHAARGALGAAILHVVGVEAWARRWG